ncbi:hypothetical protein [Paenibacillus nanchangensis]|uniref:hypothetical protein n=1 Tax=Paenibacillus nanchangensis TaxID=3348343 RepID=UPI00397CFF1B
MDYIKFEEEAIRLFQVNYVTKSDEIRLQPGDAGIHSLHSRVIIDHTTPAFSHYL